MINNNVINKKISDRVHKHFEDICGVFPRESKNETAMCDFLKKFADELNKDGAGITYWQQSEIQEGKPINNLVMIKPATEGYENSEPIALQAHLDMVCKKVEGSSHDFKEQPVTPETVGNLMTSKNKETTLGADDGIGVACIMAIFESTEIKHPRIEAVFTTDEEDGMSGAKYLPVDKVSSRLFINIDAETEGVLYYGCAGGIYANVDIPVNYHDMTKSVKVYDVKISGLLGGHSGLKIGSGHANANRLMGRMLDYLINELSKSGEQIMLSKLVGGDAKNAIASEATATIAVNNSAATNFEKEIKAIESTFKYEYKGLDDGVNVTFKENQSTCEKAVTQETLNKIVVALTTVPNGVLDMHTDDENHTFIETSSNLGVMELKDGNFSFTCFIRSSIDTKKLLVVEQIRLITQLIGAKLVADTDFPEWNPNNKSPLMKLFKETYRDIFNMDLVTEAVHAGLECGYFFKKFFDYGEADLVAIGPTIDNAHSPTETLHIDTIEKIVSLLLNVLERLDVKPVFAEPTKTIDSAAVKGRRVHNCKCMR